MIVRVPRRCSSTKPAAALALDWPQDVADECRRPRQQTWAIAIQLIPLRQCKRALLRGPSELFTGGRQTNRRPRKQLFDQIGLLELELQAAVRAPKRCPVRCLGAGIGERLLLRIQPNPDTSFYPWEDSIHGLNSLPNPLCQLMWLNKSELLGCLSRAKSVAQLKREIKVSCPAVQICCWGYRDQPPTGRRAACWR